MLNKCVSHFVKSMMNGVADATLSKRVSSIVKRHAMMGAIMAFLPFFGFETFLYLIVLWRMYYKLSEVAGVSFFGNITKNIIGAVVINIFVLVVSNLLLDLIPVIGWLGSGFIAYFAVMLSGCSYIEILAHIHGEDKVVERLDINGLDKFLKSEDK